MDSVPQASLNLAQAVSRWDVTRHPFWSDWKEGRVPAAGLAVLARELEALLPLLQRAWEQLNDESAGEVAAEQSYLWHHFAQGVIPRAELAHLSQAEELLTLTRHFLLKEASTLGVIYAVQAQLPLIASRLLDQVEIIYNAHAEPLLQFCQHLQQHSHQSGVALRYFSGRSTTEQQQACEAGQRVAEGLWNLFTGIHASYTA